MIRISEGTTRKRRISAGCGVILCLLSTACQHTTPGYPAAQDVTAMTEAKPRPSDDILTPGGSARYNSEIEGWGDRISAAAKRVCRNLKAQGMAIDCE